MSTSKITVELTEKQIEALIDACKIAAASVARPQSGQGPENEPPYRTLLSARDVLENARPIRMEAHFEPEQRANARVVKVSRGALIAKRAVLQSQISTCKLDDPLDCPDHRDSVIELDGVNFLLGEGAV